MTSAFVFDAGEAILRVAANRRGLPLNHSSGVPKFFSQPRADFVAGAAEVANHQIVPREPRVQQRLEPAVELHPLGERVADDADVVLRLQHERRRRDGAGDRHRRRAATPTTSARRPATARLSSLPSSRWDRSVPPGHIRRLHALDEPAEVERRRLVRTDEADGPVGRMLVSRPAAHRHAFTSMRRKPSFSRSSDAPCVVVNTRRGLARRARVGAIPRDGLRPLLVETGESGVMPSRIWPTARIWLPSIGLAV